MRWIGPYTINKLLLQVFNSSGPVPPESGGVYIVSIESWNGQPSAICKSLYVGSNTGESKRFRTRVGDLIADIFGFYGSKTGHHSGGQKLRTHFLELGINPMNIYIGWLVEVECTRCVENYLYDVLSPSQNRIRPAKCKKHDYVSSRIRSIVTSV